MSNGVIFKLNKAGVRELMKSQEMVEALQQEAQSYGDTSDTYIGSNRANVTAETGGRNDRSNN